jgi:tRNA-binding protein
VLPGEAKSTLGVLINGGRRSDLVVITHADFERVDIRVGRIIQVDPFPEARKPAYKLTIDFGPQIGVKRSSAQITALYAPEDLVGTLVLAVVNFPPKQIGPFVSGCLTLGVLDDQGRVVLARPDRALPSAESSSDGLVEMG